MRPGLWRTVTSAVLLTVAGCGTNRDDGVVYRAEQAPDLVINGKRFVARGLAQYHSTPGTLTPPQGGTDSTTLTPEMNAKAKATAEAVDKMTAAELADAIRLVTFRDGVEYIEAEPDVERADRIIKSKGTEVSNPSVPPPMAPGQDTPDAPMVGRSVIGTDNRTIVYNSGWGEPFHAELAIGFQGFVCSGVLIGANTALSAAHCFYDNGAWYNFDPASGSFLAAGANAARSAPNNFPYGKHFCYSVWMYNAWFSDTSNHYWDMAVMDFSQCGGDNPATTAGYTGTRIFPNQYDVYLNNNVLVYGYPVSCPGLVQWPQLCGTYGTAYTYANSGETYYLFTNDIDTSGGESGTGWSYEWWNQSTNSYWYQVVGTHIGEYGTLPWQSTKNISRRLDNVYWGLVQAASVDY